MYTSIYNQFMAGIRRTRKEKFLPCYSYHFFFKLINSEIYPIRQYGAKIKA